MVTKHAVERGIQRINNKSSKKNKDSNIRKIMRNDAFKRYFAFSNGKSKFYRYVRKDGCVFKYVIDKFSKDIITVHQVDFEKEMEKGFNIKFLVD